MLTDEIIDGTALSAQRAITEQSNNPALPIIDNEKMLFPGADTKQVLRLFRSLEWRAERDADGLELEVFDRFVTLLPKLGLVPLFHDEDTAEFHWARVGVLIAGLGYKAHKQLARRLTSLYPDCPIDPRETLDQWTARVTKAHGLCGWPTTLAWVDFVDVCALLGEIDKDTLNALPVWTVSWLKVVGLLHLLKHMRHDQRGHAVVVYRGTATTAGYEVGTNMLGEMRRLRSSVQSALRLPRFDGRAKAVHPMAQAMAWVLNDLPMSALLRRVSLASLPGTVLGNSWTRLVPGPTNMQPGGFARCGMQLEHCWVACDGHVTPITGGHEEVLRYSWGIEPHTAEDERAVREFTAALPATYEHMGFPSDVLFAAFPNLQGATPAVRAFFDALICLALLRPDMPAASAEMPMTIIFPSDPTPEASTNQGKTTFAHALARSMLVDVPCTMVKDVESAPASRSLAATIERYGSLCLDEYRPVRSKAHLLAHDSLQALCTGQAVNVGRVLSNDESLVRLRNGICASAKCVSLPPDMVNRTLFLWLDTMGDAQRDNVEMAQAISTGRLSIQVRLAAVACIERLGLGASKARASQHFRFPVMFGLATDLLTHRAGISAADAKDTLDACAVQMRFAYEDHYRLAEDTGLAAIQEDAVSVRIRAGTLFETLSVDDMYQYEQALTARGDDKGRLTPAAMLKARSELMGFTGRSLSQVAASLTGNRYVASDRAIALALGRDLVRLMPAAGDGWTPPDLVGLAGWTLTRTSDAGKTPRFYLRKVDSETFERATVGQSL